VLARITQSQGQPERPGGGKQGVRIGDRDQVAGLLALSQADA